MDCTVDVIKWIAPLLRTLRMHISLAINLGVGIGTNYSNCTLIPESLKLSGVILERVEFILDEVTFQPLTLQDPHPSPLPFVLHLEGVMTVHDMTRENWKMQPLP
jgi:hypothetical protein